MDNATQGSERRSSNNRRGRNNNNRNRNNNRGRGGRNRPSNNKPKKKQNPILAFFSKLFGLDSKPKKSGPRKDRAASQRSEDSAAKDDDQQPEVSSARLYVGNLSYDTSESDLFDHFATVGQVKSAEVVRDRNDRSKGFGFVEMNSVEMAQTASEKFHRTDYMGRQIIVAGAKK